MTNTRKPDKPLMSSYNMDPTLARILARENIRIMHSEKITDASFDTKNRILRIPVLSGITEDAYKAILCHEVGHALFTPNDELAMAAAVEYIDPKNPKRVHHFLNCIEDYRIESAIISKYGGVVGILYEGYKDLHELNDFWGIKQLAEQGFSLDKLHFMDRMILYMRLER